MKHQIIPEKMNLNTFFLLLLLSCISVNSQNFTDKTILFEGRVKVNALESYREDIQDFFGKTLGRKIESHKIYDKVHFDGGGFVAFVYHKDNNMVLQKDDFIKSMQVGLLIPTEEYDDIKEKIKSYGVEPMLPQNERYKDHSKYYYFHAPGGQVFRIVNSNETKSKIRDTSSYNAVKAEKYGADDYGMKKYVFAFLKRGPNKSISKEEANKLQGAHLRNINRMAKEGKLVLAGPFYGKDDLRGIYIFNVSSIEEAEALTNTDPAIKAGSLEMELKEWYGTAAMIELLEIHKTIEKKAIVD